MVHGVREVSHGHGWRHMTKLWWSLPKLNFPIHYLPTVEAPADFLGWETLPPTASKLAESGWIFSLPFESCGKQAAKPPELSFRSLWTLRRLDPGHTIESSASWDREVCRSERPRQQAQAMRCHTIRKWGQTTSWTKDLKHTVISHRPTIYVQNPDSVLFYLKTPDTRRLGKQDVSKLKYMLTCSKMLCSSCKSLYNL